MPLSYAHYSGNGTNRNFDVPCEYLSRTHVAVRVDGVSVPFSWLDTFRVQTATAPQAGTVVEVRRTTPREDRLVTFTDGSTLVETDLNTSSLQSFFLAQEAFDQGAASMGVTEDGQFSALTRRITNLQDPRDNQDAVTKGWALNTTNTNVAQAVAARVGAEQARDQAAIAIPAARDSAIASINTTRDNSIASVTASRNAAVSDMEAVRAATAGFEASAKEARDSANAYRASAANERTLAQAARDASEAARDVALSYRNTSEAHKDAAASSATASAEARNLSMTYRDQSRTAKDEAEAAALRAKEDASTVDTTAFARKDGVTFIGKVRSAPNTATEAGLSLPFADGPDPSASVAGDVWVNGNQMKLRVRDGVLTIPGTNLNASWTAKQTFGGLINLLPGTAPSSPANGDMWSTPSGVFARVNNVTYNLTDVGMPMFGNVTTMTGNKRTTGQWESLTNNTNYTVVRPQGMQILGVNGEPAIEFSRRSDGATEYQFKQQSNGNFIILRAGSNNGLVIDSGGGTTMNFGGGYTFNWQSDGNVVLYRAGGTPIWTPSGGWTSMRELKENLEPIENALDKVKLLQGWTYNMITSPDEKEAGVIAEDVQAVLPEAVGHLSTPEKDYLLVRYERLTALLIEATKELEARVAQLEAASAA